MSTENTQEQGLKIVSKPTLPQWATGCGVILLGTGQDWGELSRGGRRIFAEAA